MTSPSSDDTDSRPPLRSAAEDESISVLAILNILLRSWKWLVLLPAAIAVLSVVMVLARPREFRAESVLMPDATSSGSSRMSSLASRLGVASSASGESLDFFARVLESRELLRAAVRSEYSVPSGDDVDGMHRTLVQLYDLDASAAGRERAAMDQLDDAVDVEISPMPGLITLYTRAASPELATQINRRLLDLLDEFNVHRRQSQAAAERRFIQSRLEEAQRELIEAESALQSFLDQNRRYEESPQLRFEAGRLQRQVDLRQAVYTSLMQSLEQARMDEVRNTPVVTVVDPPEGSVRGDGRSVVRAMLIASLLGTILGLGVAFGREVMRTQRERHPGDYAEFLTLLRGRSGASANRAPEDPEVQEEDRGSGSNFAAS